MGKKRKAPSAHPKGIERFLALILALTMVVSSVVNGQIVGVVYMSKNYVSASGETYKVSLRYEEGVLPSGCELEVRELSSTSEEYGQYLEASKAVVDGRVIDAGFLDIGIYKDGVKVEPDGEVKVEIRRTDGSVPEGTVSVVHFEEKSIPSLEAEEETGSVIEADSVVEAAAVVKKDLSKSTTEEGVEDGTIITTQLMETETTDDKVTFTTDSFSVYGVIYTVDFSYNGYEFSIPGGGFISLSQLVEELRIVEEYTPAEDTLLDEELAVPEETIDEQDDNRAGSEEPSTEELFMEEPSAEFEGEEPGAEQEDEEPGVVLEEESNLAKSKEFSSNETEPATAKPEIVLNEDTRLFLENVEDVAFSAPDLLWLGKVEEESIVSNLKEDNNLEIVYSGNLTVRDISRINSQYVAAGDWAMISLKPIETDETLTVKMKNGDVFVVQVAGQQLTGSLNSQYTSADGDLVITACAPVGTLPEGTRVVLREIDPFGLATDDDADEEMHLYTDSLSAVANKLWEEHRTLGEAKVVDISFIDADGNEIEPEDEVDVSLLLNEALETTEGMHLGLAHIPIPSEEGAEAELLEAYFEGNETVFASDAFSIYVIFNGNISYTDENEPVVFDKGWIRFGGNMQARNSLPDGYFNYPLFDYVSTETAWKWLTVELYELKSGVSEDGYANHNNYNKISEYKYLAGDTSIVVEDYDFNGRDVLCAVFTDRYLEPSEGETTWRFIDAKNGADIRTNYGGIALAHSRQYYDYFGWSGQWDVDDPACLRVYLSREQEVERVPHTDYIVRYYHPDGSFDAISGSLESGSSALTFSYGDKIKVNEENYSGLAVAAGHDAITYIDTTAGTATIQYDADVPIVKLNFYYKEKIELKTGGTVSGEPVYDTRIDEHGNKIYDTHTTGLHTDKTATVVTDSDNPAYNDGRTFNLTLESWNVGESGADIGMVLDASGSMTWSSTVPTAVPVTDEIITKYNLPTSTNGLSNWLNLTQVNDILDKTRTDSSQMGYNGYTYYIQDAANGDEFVPLGYYDSDTQSNTTPTNGYYQTSNNITFAKKNEPDSGWYYVNTSNARNYKNGSPKQYANWGVNDGGYLWLRNTETGAEYRTETWVGNDTNGTGTSFYIKDGELWAVWTRGTSSNTPKVYQSRVFMKPKDGVVKDESLQHAIARFTAILNAQSPQSQIAMTRFSRNGSGGGATEDGFSNDQLALLNWQNDSITITAALNQLYKQPNGTPSTTSNVGQNDSDNLNPLTVYNYSFTGQTSTKRGIDAFMVKLTKGSDNNNKYNPKATHSNNSKYLIVFTDGKDTDTSDWEYDETSKTITSYTTGSALDKAKTLKTNDYTIFTVLMRSGSMSNDDVDRASAFLKEMSGTKNSTAAQKDNFFFDIAFDDAKALAAAFEKIAKEIAKPLEGYMVRDYIDPRFDLIDADGNIRTRLDSYGTFLPVVITLNDGKRALLKYDSDKKMFYIEVENQSVPTSPQNATQVTVNTVELTVRAKDDFIGGNDMLTNGNESGQNQVFKPVEGYIISANEPVAANPDTGTYPKKDYPKTTTNPATYGTTLLNYEDTIFLGETISPIELFEQVGTMDDETADDDHLSVYFGYLKRVGKTLHEDENYYINILKNGVLPSGHQNINNEEITFTGGTTPTITLKLPYYYIKDENNIRSYAGGELHQADRVGFITYEWKAISTGDHTLTGNAFADYTSTTLNDVKYQLYMKYVPDRWIQNDGIANNGSARTLALIGESGSTTELIRDPVGDAAIYKETTSNEGVAVLHVVAGKIKVVKRIKVTEDEWNKLQIQAGDDGLTFVFIIKKDGEEYTTVTLKSKNDDRTIISRSNDGDYIELSSSAWTENLPQGDYTIEETSMPVGFTFKTITSATITTDDGGAQFAAPISASVGIPTSSSESLIWKIGQFFNNIPASLTYGLTDHSYTMVMDGNKEVDPAKSSDNGKNYLNAQIGKAIIENEPPRTADIKIVKVDDDDTPNEIGGAKFSLKRNNKTLINLIIVDKNGASVAVDESGVFEIPEGGVTIKDLSSGDYILTEKSAPAGFVISVKPVEFSISTSGVITDSANALNNGKVNFISASNTYMVQNQAGAQLPATGGSGTLIFYTIGAILTLLSAIMLSMKRKAA